MAERVELYSEETEGSEEPLDVHGQLLKVGDNVRSTADFSVSGERWVGVVRRAGVETPDECCNGIEVAARAYLPAGGWGRGAILYSAAYLWERTSSVSDVSDEETFT